MSQPSCKFVWTSSQFMVIALKAVTENCSAVLGQDPHCHRGSCQAPFPILWKTSREGPKGLLKFPQTIFLSLKWKMFHKCHLIRFTSYIFVIIRHLFSSAYFFHFWSLRDPWLCQLNEEKTWEVIWLPDISTYWEGDLAARPFQPCW